jgi:hypothetical protein
MQLQIDSQEVILQDYKIFLADRIELIEKKQRTNIQNLKNAENVQTVGHYSFVGEMICLLHR